MERSGKLLLDALRCAVHGEKVEWTAPVEASELHRLNRIANEHSVFPMLAQAAAESPALSEHTRIRESMLTRAKRLTLSQAQRTAEFLLLMDELEERGLCPVILKGIICRSLYPHPEQRASVDEDLLVKPDEMRLYCDTLLELGLSPFGEIDAEDPREAAFKDTSRGLYVEVHAEYLPSESAAYGDCNRPLEGADERAVEYTVYGRKLRSLAPTDNLLFLILHAYKHFLHGGVGIRQVMDINLIAERFCDEIDWQRVIDAAKELRVEHFIAACLRIGENRLGFPHNKPFEPYSADEGPLLEDIISGGLYGVVDINRAHSSTMTLEAVAAGRSGKRRKGALHSLFLPLKEMKGRYPYLRRHGWLLPVAWVQRIAGYLSGRGRNTDPAKSLKIGKDRVALLREYGIID